MSFKDLPIVFMTSRLWRHSNGNRHKVVLYFTLFILANLVEFLEPLLVAFIINTVQEQGITPANFWYLMALSALFLGRTILFWAFHGPARVIENSNAFLARANFKKYLIEGTLHLPAEWHASHHSGDTIDRINKATEALYDYSSGLFMVISPAVKFTTSYLALIYFNRHASYIVAICSVVALWIILRFDVTLRKNWRMLNRSENVVSEKIFDVVSNVTTVIILRIEELLSKEIVKKIARPFGLYVHTQKINEAKWFLVSLCSSAMMFLTFATFLVSYLRSGQVIMIGTLFAIYRYVYEISDIFFNIAWRYSDIVRQKTKVENGEELSAQFREKERSAPLDLRGHWGTLSINHLTFSYKRKGEGELHLDDVSLSIRRGERIALIGESGSGKTTFMKLLLDLYTPKHVEVLVDERPVQGGLCAIGHSITLIPQEPELFTTTIRNNITFGVPHPDRLLKKFTDMAAFTHVVLRLPRKLESNIMEKGVNLSGGEKQRLALSRGLLAASDKPIVLLDEPTSSVDSRTEMRIYDNILNAFKDKVIISSIHRLHMLHRFDHVYMFKGGRIVGSGTLAQMKKDCPEFKELWEKYHLKRADKTP